MPHLVNALLDFIHQAQKERGLTSLWLRGGAGADRDELKAQRLLLDRAAGAVAGAVENALRSAGIAPLLESHWLRLKSALNALRERRDAALAQRLEPAAALRFYTFDLIFTALGLAANALALDSRLDPLKVSAFLHFLQLKERIGQERAEGIGLVLPQTASDPDSVARVRGLVEEQAAYERLFLTLAQDEQREAYDALKNRSPIFQRVAAINSALAQGDSCAPVMEAYTARDWFAVFTAKMDLLQEAALAMLAQLGGPESLSGAEPPSTAPAFLERPVEDVLDYVRSLPLFAGVGETSLRRLLAQARVTGHETGSLILAQGEPMARFGIVLEGWVKIFKGDPDGRESVIQVAGRGEPVLETAIAGAGLCPASAQAVEPVRLLSFPCAALRDQLGQDKILAINMLTAVARQSHNLITHIEQLTLRTAEQRIGWFLLQQRLAGDQNRLDIPLPYDKALVAALLGIKPETFSRALQTFRERGFETGRHVLTMPDIHALCGFCTTDLAQQCERPEASACRRGDFPKSADRTGKG